MYQGSLHQRLCIDIVLILPMDRTLRNDIKSQIEEMRKTTPNFNPKLSIIQVGAREDSSVYVNMKKKAAKEVIDHSPHAL